MLFITLGDGSIGPSPRPDNQSSQPRTPPTPCIPHASNPPTKPSTLVLPALADRADPTLTNPLTPCARPRPAQRPSRYSAIFAIWVGHFATEVSNFAIVLSHFL
jgi:hypothetical protein